MYCGPPVYVHNSRTRDQNSDKQSKVKIPPQPNSSCPSPILSTSLYLQHKTSFMRNYANITPQTYPNFQQFQMELVCWITAPDITESKLFSIYFAYFWLVLRISLSIQLDSKLGLPCRGLIIWGPEPSPNIFIVQYLK